MKCYHRRVQSAERDSVFRLQFHTCTIHGAQLWFGKGELDEACSGTFLVGQAKSQMPNSYIITIKPEPSVQLWPPWAEMALGYQLSLVFYDVLFYFGGLCSFSCAVNYCPHSHWVTPAHHSCVIEMRYRFLRDNRFSVGFTYEHGRQLQLLVKLWENSWIWIVVIIKNINAVCSLERILYTNMNLQIPLLMINIISWKGSSVS